MNGLLHTARHAGLISLLCVVISVAQPVAAAQTPKTPAKQASDEQPSQKLDLDATSITGSRELPTVMNILPWKHAPTIDLPGAPDDSLLKDVLQPVNRVEYRRELRYGDAVSNKP